ncbi:polysaccharide lyase family 8 protein [Desarmillaria tabescens]|uniref:Polysaccharide lyase family 8 protein n=1 Tax=Armillaria tabescens TaxID=1929756 RepID=A0AA39NGQ3_ARMTA|nr:polysaccharide lyase family 8 protein [Desarmillaria tabescens]KAK0465143.1 polysaccharide lyase family 8 protein [Desarmillaria tabescens]
MFRVLLFAVFSTCLFLPGFGADIDVVRQRRYSGIVGASTGASSIPKWLSSLGENGKWPDDEINYTAGCDAQRGSWPAQQHWRRIDTFAAAYHGGFKNALQYAGDPDLRASITLAMNYWFSNDFDNIACLDAGGTDACPCGTPGFWNTNWASNVITVPPSACLLLDTSLSDDELAGCLHIIQRAYNTFQTGIIGVSSITGSNLLDIAGIGLDLGLLTSNETILTDAYDRAHGELSIKTAVSADGIRPDGSFGQHNGLLYNGDYGKDYANDVFNLEISSANTQWAAPDEGQNAFATLLTANLWMIFRNVVTGVLHWDYAIIGRVISLPVADNQATASLKTNLTQIRVLGELWNSSDITRVYEVLEGTSKDANIGAVVGNRMFYTNDYMVQRGSGYVTTLKMFSKRTLNSECVNSQNPYGFHLSDGTVYTYLTGNDYEDIFAAWDWNLIPGITVDYNATVLDCDESRISGVESFVGGASNQNIGVAAMRYENPITKSLQWQKSWFFLPNDVQYVMVANIASTTSAPVFSVLDQRRHLSNVMISGSTVTESGNFSSVESLWHGGIGYTFNASNSAVSLSVQLGNKTGSWESIGTSDEGDISVDLFSAWLSHDDTSVPVSYAVYPATSSYDLFVSKSQESDIIPVRNDGSVSAVLDVADNIAMIIFWDVDGGSVTITLPTPDAAPITVHSTGNSAVILDLDEWKVMLSDPSQTLANIALTVSLGSGTPPPGWTDASTTKSAYFDLPSDGFWGQSVTQDLITD